MVKMQPLSSWDALHELSKYWSHAMRPHDYYSALSSTPTSIRRSALLRLLFGAQLIADFQVARLCHCEVLTEEHAAL